jgi:hypothetical protein
MGTSERAPSSVGLTVGIAICTSCTLTGLGDYEVDTCSQPAGTTSTVQSVGQFTDTPTLSSINGSSPVGSFVANDCVEAVTSGGNLQSTCSLLVGVSPQQPVVVPIGGSYAAAAIATTTPCVDGQLSFQALTLGVPSMVAQAAAAPSCGAALPALAPLPGDEAMLIAWYETAISTREDPIGSCSGASAAPLVFAIANGVTTLSPEVGMPTMLTGQATSVRPPAVIPVPGSSQVVVASPDGNAVSVWPINGDGSVGTAFQLPGLSGARAVSGAASPDGRLALAAEIGCAPQSIALAIVTQGDLFRVTTVAAADGAFAVNPTVAWVPSEGYWIVSWISGTSGTAHVVAQRFDTNGNAVGSNIDPSVSALTAAVTAGGALFGYTQPKGMNGTFLNISLGCAE